MFTNDGFDYLDDNFYIYAFREGVEDWIQIGNTGTNNSWYFVNNYGH